MNNVKKPMILVGTLGGFALFLMSVYRLFIGVENYLTNYVAGLGELDKAAKAAAKQAARPGYDKVSYIMLAIAVVLLALGIWSYISAKKKQKQLTKKDPANVSPYLNRIEKVVGTCSRVRPVLIMLLAGAVFACMHPRFLTVSNFTNIISQYSHYGILAAGVCFAILIGGIDISLGSVLAFAGVIAAMIVSSGASVVLAILAALVIGALAGCFNGVFIAHFKLQPMIVTLATMSIFRGACMVVTNAKPVSCGKLPGSEIFKAIGQKSLFGVVPYTILLLALVYVVTFYILNMTSYGRHVYAVGGNEDAARLSGINVESTKIIAHTICGLFAGIAGIVVTARGATAQPTAGDGYEMDAIAAAVIGGISLRGGEGQVLFTIAGTIIIGMLNNILNLLNVASHYQPIIKGAVILFAVLLDSRSRKK